MCVCAWLSFSLYFEEWSLRRSRISASGLWELTLHYCPRERSENFETEQDSLLPGFARQIQPPEPFVRASFLSMYVRAFFFFLRGGVCFY